MAYKDTLISVGVLFGGRSAEHEVSIASATSVVSVISRDKYKVVPIFVSREGKWLMGRFENGKLDVDVPNVEVCLFPGGQGEAVLIDPDGQINSVLKIDILFPVLHGMYGEDGSVQGLAEVARVPLVGCGIIGSAAALDKRVAKSLFREAGLPVARAVAVEISRTPSFHDLASQLGLPFFIKPARQGSSFGVNKVSDENNYTASLADAFKYDKVVLAEEFIEGREIEVSVLQDTDNTLFVSRPGEILPADGHDFYDFDAKYINTSGSRLVAPALLENAVEERLRSFAKDAFYALGCEGMARVDFFLVRDTNIVVNEVNTIPGFTISSMYSKAMAASGIAFDEVVDRLIQHGLARAGLI
ncbi:D-alanine--D-alanine ligase [Paracoccus sp. S4493]|uniref:D-alanine--D-alanine ligase family protein n=1 Tax=Paracoccus sp. S4493 TaxID=579490 RepID=UPI0005FA8D80|nr:D-alanine--D-alanine ligase family protein [Paracoccus sp. S4493]KJZ29899.1 D-alanine--D-alanine ligase [Paracoccus sp. S4493]